MTQKPPAADRLIQAKAQCTNKIGMSQRLAKEIAARSTNRDKKRSAYLCPICNAWHLGQHPKRFKRVGGRDDDGDNTARIG